MLLVNNPYYVIPVNKSKEIYYSSLSKMIYYYFSQNTLILSNLTNHFNILTKEEEETITKKEVEIYVIDPLISGYLDYQYKIYKILVYSAYRELNSALYHLSQVTLDEIYYYNDEAYYFLKNGMNNLLINSERQMWTLTEKYEERIKSGHRIIIICCVCVSLVIIVCFYCYYFFYKKIKIKRNKLLSIFNEINNNSIISSLQKCENFCTKLKEKHKDNIKKDFLLETSSENYSHNDNDNIANIPNILIENKNNDINKVNKGNKLVIDENKKNKKFYTFNIGQIFIFLFLLIFQLVIYIYYYNKMTLYLNIVTYEYYISMYASNFIFIFISLREYIFDKNTTFYNKTSKEYLEYTLDNYYTIFSSSSKLKDIYRVHFPNSYQIFLNYLYNGKLCEFINNFNMENPNDMKYECQEFFHKSSGYGFFTIIATFVEEIRTIKNKVDYYYGIAEEKNFTYNESYFNDYFGYYEEFYKQYSNNIDEYKKFNPANVFKLNSFKEVYITYLYINTQVYSFLISESLNQFEQVFAKYNSINLMINIIFIIIVFLGFFIIFIPFLLYQHKILAKIKNMLYVIPSELYNDIPKIINLLGIESSIIK